MSSQTGSGSGILRKPTHGADEDFRLTSHGTPGSITEPPSSPQHSVRSASVKRDRHWLMKEEDNDGDLPFSSVDGSVVISRTAMAGSASISKHSLIRRDSHSEFDRCMRDLKALESATFEHLTELDKTMKAYVDEAASRLQGQLSRTVLQQTDAERRERAQAVMELRAEICDQGKRHTQAVGHLRKEVGTCQSDIAELVRLRHQVTPISAPQDPLPVWMSQVSELEKTLAHPRVAHETQHELHKTQVEDVQRGFKAELSKELHALRSDAQQDRSLLEAHLEKMRMAEDTSKALATRIDEMRRTIVDFQQDALSETTVFRRRVEQVAGDSDAQAQQVPSLRRLVERHENQRVADSNRLVEQLQTLEKRLDKSVSATRRPHEADLASVLLERVRLVEASVREAKTGTRSLEMVTGDVRRNCTDLGIRIDRVEDEVKKNGKLIVELEERTAGTAAADAIEAIEQDVRGALQEENPKHGSARSCSPPIRSASTKSLFRSHSQHASLAPVDGITADLRSSGRSGSTSDAERRASERLASPDLSNSSYRSLTASHHAWQPPLIPTGETSLGDENLKNIQGVLPLSDGLKQSLQGLVSAVHRTFPKKDATARPVSARTSSARITDKKEDESAGKVVFSSSAQSAGGSTCSPMLQQFRAAQELPPVTSTLDSEPASTESLAMRFTGRTAGTGSSSTPNIMSRMLAQQRNSRQTLGSMKDTALRQRISTMEVEAPHTARSSPKLPSACSSPARHERLPVSSSPMQQRRLANTKASLVMAAATTVSQPDGVNYQPAFHQPRLSLSRYLSQ